MVKTQDALLSLEINAVAQQNQLTFDGYQWTMLMEPDSLDVYQLMVLGRIEKINKRMAKAYNKRVKVNFFC